MTKRECFEKIAGCFFFNTSNGDEALKGRRSRFDKLLGAKLPKDYADFLWDWGLHLERELASERNIESDMKLAEAIKVFSNATSIEFSHAIPIDIGTLSIDGKRSFSIDDEEVLKAMLKALKEVFVQRYTWEGWTLEKVNEENMDLFQYYHDRGEDDTCKIGRPAKYPQLPYIGWKLYFILSLEEMRYAISLTNDKLDIITDFLDFFKLYDYKDCKDKKSFERDAIKSIMNHFRKKPEFGWLQHHCETIREHFIECETSVFFDKNSSPNIKELLHLPKGYHGL